MKYNEHMIPDEKLSIFIADTFFICNPCFSYASSKTF